MVILSNDGYYREIIPAQSVGSNKRINLANISSAYCHHCKQKFNTKPSQEQMEIWKAHICDTRKLKKAQPKND